MIRPVSFSAMPVKFGLTAQRQAELQDKLVAQGEKIAGWMDNTTKYGVNEIGNLGEALQGVGTFLRAVTEIIPEDGQG